MAHVWCWLAQAAAEANVPFIMSGAATASIEQVMARAVERVPLGRLAEPEDVANVVAFLASPRSGYVSGAIVGIDGAAFPIVV